MDSIFYEKDDQVEIIAENLENILIKDEESIKLLPELYAVQADKVEEEYKFPKSQDRIPLGNFLQIIFQIIYFYLKINYLKEKFLINGANRYIS